MKRKLKVLHIISAFGMGGVEIWLRELMRHAWLMERCSFDFLLTSGSQSIMDEEIRALGGKLFYIPFSRRNGLAFFNRFRDLLARESYDVIHDHGDYSGGLHLLFGLGRLPSTRIVHIHNRLRHISDNYASSPSRRLVAAVGRQMVRRLSTQVLGTSHEALASYALTRADGIPESHVLHCGISIPRFQVSRTESRQALRQEFAWPRNAKVVIFVGRFDTTLDWADKSTQKNSWFALAIAIQAMATDEDLHLLMVGEHSPITQCATRRLIPDRLSHRISMPGIRGDVNRLMRGSDVLLFPSRQEGLGMVAVEAQVCGLPVLVSDQVPRAACLFPERYSHLALDESEETWARELIRQSRLPRVEDREIQSRLLDSPFTIEYSAARLYGQYTLQHDRPNC